jgi:hypothetical protein
MLGRMSGGNRVVRLRAGTIPDTVSRVTDPSRARSGAIFTLPSEPATPHPPGRVRTSPGQRPRATVKPKNQARVAKVGKVARKVAARSPALSATAARNKARAIVKARKVR